MSYSVLVFDNKVLECIYSLNLRVYTASDTISKNSVTEVIELLKVMPNVELIVCAETINNEEVGTKIYEYIKENDLNIAIVIFGSSDKYDKAGDFDRFSTFLPLATTIRTFVRTCARHLAITSKDIASKIMPEYLGIPIEHFIKLDRSACDLFTRVSEVNAELEFDRLFSANESLTTEAIEELKSQGIKQLYIESSKRVNFVNSYTQSMLPKVIDTTQEHKRSEVMETTTSMLLEQIKEVGLTPATMALADKTVKEVIKQVKVNKDFSNYLKKLLTNTKSYGHRHFQALSYLTFHMLESIDWGTFEHQDKLAYAALFHDMVLTDDKLIQIHSQEQLEAASLSKEDKDLVNNHALLASQLIAKAPNAPYEVDIIIKQHHGSKNGSGFPVSVAGDLNRLAALFHVAHVYVENLLKDSKDPTRKEHQDMIFDMDERYEENVFKNLIKTLGWMLLEKN